jgi:MFS family permease
MTAAEAVGTGQHDHPPADRSQSSLGRSFGRLWFGNSTSALGDGMWFAALPLLAASLSRDPRLVSLLEAMAGLPWLLFGLHAGALADRWDKRTLMWRSDLVRLVIVALIAALVAARAVTIPVLLVLVFALATVGTLFSSAAPALLPSVVPKELLGRANARLAGTSTTARNFAGPVLGSLIFGIVPWVPFFADAVTFGASAWSVRGLPRLTTTDLPARRPISHEVVDGLRWILKTVHMRVLAIAAALLSVATAVFLGCFVLFVLGPLKLPQVAYGLLTAVYAVGGVGGSIVASRIIDRLGLRWASAGAAFLGAVAFLVIGLVPLWPMAALMLGLLGVATMLWNITTVTLRQQITPKHLLGRVSSAFGIIGVGSAALGAPAGGAIASSFGLPAAIICAGALCAVGTVMVALLLPAAGTASEAAAGTAEDTAAETAG